MPFVTDPDDLDRWQWLFDPNESLIWIKGLGASRVSKKTDGAPEDNGSTFTSATGLFQTNSVAQNDILTIATGEEGVIGHWTVDSVTDESNLEILETFPDVVTPQTGVTYKITQPGSVAGPNGGVVADGVVEQIGYSFTKEEWITKSDADMDDLMLFIFPFEPLTTEQYELGGATHGGWDFGDDTTKKLIRTGGWQQLDSSGNILQDWPCVISLGDVDAAGQPYYQLHASDIDPTNFVNTGPIDECIKSYDEVTGPDAGTGFVITSNERITRNDGGNWYTDGYRVGGRINIRNAEDSGNDTTTGWTLTAVQDQVDGYVEVASAPLTNNAGDQTMIAAVNMRYYVVNRIRQKTFSYTEADLSDIGRTFIDHKAHRFALGQSSDPAITYFDGALEGDGTNDVFQETETHSSGSNGVTTDQGDGTFTFDSSGVSPAFNDGVLRVGDVLNLTSGS
jgi:hypothetical protein